MRDLSEKSQSIFAYVKHLHDNKVVLCQPCLIKMPQQFSDTVNVTIQFGISKKEDHAASEQANVIIDAQVQYTHAKENYEKASEELRTAECYLKDLLGEEE